MTSTPYSYLKNIAWLLTYDEAYIISSDDSAIMP